MHLYCSAEAVHSLNLCPPAHKGRFPRPCNIYACGYTYYTWSISLQLGSVRHGRSAIIFSVSFAEVSFLFLVQILWLCLSAPVQSCISIWRLFPLVLNLVQCFGLLMFPPSYRMLCFWDIIYYHPWLPKLRQRYFQLPPHLFLIVWLSLLIASVVRASIWIRPSFSDFRVLMPTFITVGFTFVLRTFLTSSVERSSFDVTTSLYLFSALALAASQYNSFGPPVGGSCWCGADVAVRRIPPLDGYVRTRMSVTLLSISSVLSVLSSSTSCLFLLSVPLHCF